MGKVITNALYSPQNYLELVTGNCYSIHGDDDCRAINKALKENNLNYKSFSMLDIEKVLANDLDVVLVECDYFVGSLINQTYRWYEVPKTAKIEQ